MFDFSKTKGELSMTKEDVLENQQMIFEYYFGQSIEPKRRYKNPLRLDTHEGCFFKWKSGLKFYDYPAQKTYDVFSFIEELYNTDFFGALSQIQKDFNTGIIHNKAINKPSVRFEKDEKHIIQITPRPFNKLDLKWWGEYLIDREELKRENIYSVEKLYIDSFRIPTPDLCFAYYYPEIDKTKIYKPLERKEFKWYSNVPFDYIDTLSELPRASSGVLITKAKKCKTVLRKVFEDTCATQGENYHAIPKSADVFFDENYDSKDCWFDTDKTGIAANKSLNERGYGWVNIPQFLYDCCKIKDPSDYVKEYKELEYIVKLLKEKNMIKNE